jgi:hypothetical protein
VHSNLGLGAKIGALENRCIGKSLLTVRRWRRRHALKSFSANKVNQRRHADVSGPFLSQAVVFRDVEICPWRGADASDLPKPLQ